MVFQKLRAAAGLHEIFPELLFQAGELVRKKELELCIAPSSSWLIESFESSGRENCYHKF